jgi:isopentenyl-diphosphate Delta-isomerase
MLISQMTAEHVILVDAQDNEIGLMEKQEAHQKGTLHRAFSIFIFNTAGELLLQRRAWHKYHSGGLWTNTCCSHPRPGEGNLEAAQRRLQEEMGMTCTLAHAFSFLYEQAVGDLIEHELDHVFIGVSDDLPTINPEEVAEWKAISMVDLGASMATQPEVYTVWFRLCLERVERFRQGGGMEHSGQIAYFS